MATLLELASDIISSHASTTPMSSEELVQEIRKVYSALQALEAGKEVASAEETKPAITVKEAFKKNEVLCMVCGKGGMKTLTRHLGVTHAMKPGEYRKQFGLPGKQPLTAKSYSESRRKMAEERGLGDVLAKARETRAAKLKKNKAPVPAFRPKSEVPILREKPSVPAKIRKRPAPAKPANSKAAKKTK
jgi:predicted transcriptional regulator